MREKSARTGGKVSRTGGEAGAPKIAMATRSAARIYPPGRGRDANLPKIPSWFANLLEVIFSYFAKI
jgi:hypothetical protein